MIKAKSTPDKSVSRLNSLLAQLDEGLTSSGRGDMEQARSVSCKLLQLVQTQEKTRKEMAGKGCSGMDVMLSTLENSKDHQVTMDILNILLELLSAGSGGRVSNLVCKGGSQILLQTLVRAAKDSPTNDELMLVIHSLLAKVGPKDAKFATKARLCGALPVTLTLVKQNLHNQRLLLPCMHTIKAYSASIVNAVSLGRNGAVELLFKIVGPFSKRQSTFIKITLDTLATLLKSKTNARRAVDRGNIVFLLNVYQDWHRHDARHSHVPVRRGLLTCLKQITAIKHGRRAFLEADGMKIFYTTSQECLTSRGLDLLVNLSTMIMRKCCPKNRLPLPTIRSVHHFPLPVIPTTGPVAQLYNLPAGVDDVADESDDNLEQDSEQENENEEEDDFLEKDPDIETDLDKLKMKPTLDRSEEALKMYEQFFPELLDSFSDTFSKVNENINHQSAKNMPSPIVIPTASSNDKCSSSTGKGLPIQNSMASPLIDGDDSTQKPRSEPGAQKMAKGNSFKDPQGCGHSADSRDFVIGFRGLCLEVSEQSLICGCLNAKVCIHVDASRFGDLKKNTPELSVKEAKRLEGANWCQKLAASKKAQANVKCTGGAPTSVSVQRDLKEKMMGGKESRDKLDPSHDNELYSLLASNTKSVAGFSKMAFPDYYGHIPPLYREPSVEREYGVQRSKIFQDIERLIRPGDIIDRVVYDLDMPSLVSEDGDCLKFCSEFESGNLRKAIHIRRYEYDLILDSDINSNRHHQWFYFEVSGMESGVPYRFNIVNCEKVNSQFNYGMQPVMYSVREAMAGRPHWARAGTDICYYKNSFSRSSAAAGGQRGKSYYTLTFTVTFFHKDDACYFAYHFPYTYTSLMAHLQGLGAACDQRQIYFKQQTLCQSMGGNGCPVVTITAAPQSTGWQDIYRLRNRPYIFLTSRVHPGESNSSWVMKGSLEFLMSDDPLAQSLRESYIFKIVPMLNADGVINGSYRCSLGGEDLNRQWSSPDPELHPTIFHTKGLLQYLASIAHTPLVYCDYHGHSRKKNVFLYGCSMKETIWQTAAEAKASSVYEDLSYRTLPRILHQIAPAFCLSSCNFVVEKSKASTARVVVWRDIGVLRSYTMESTYCGCDQGIYKGSQMGSQELEEMGAKFCVALLRLKSSLAPAESLLLPPRGAWAGPDPDTIETVYKPSRFFSLEDEPRFAEEIDYSAESLDEQEGGEDDVAVAAAAAAAPDDSDENRSPHVHTGRREYC
ncbi:cytosolic carboxypeptidase 1 isoform X1 [Lampetra fluviatilis]